MERCPKCRTRTRLADNEFYGIGLAVHRFIITCDHCGWSMFVSDADQQEATVGPVDDQPGAGTRQFRRMPGWVRSWIIGQRPTT